MSHKFLKKNFSFQRVFFGLFCVFIFSFFLVKTTFAANPLTSGLNVVNNFYGDLVSSSKKVSEIVVSTVGEKIDQVSNLSLPKISTRQINIPEIPLPKISTREIQLPQIPLPKISTREIQIPKISLKPVSDSVSKKVSSATKNTANHVFMFLNGYNNFISESQQNISDFITDSFSKPSSKLAKNVKVVNTHDNTANISESVNQYGSAVKEKIIQSYDKYTTKLSKVLYKPETFQLTKISNKKDLSVVNQTAGNGLNINSSTNTNINTTNSQNPIKYISQTTTTQPKVVTKVVYVPGPMGPKGDKGDTGPQGPAGVNGLSIQSSSTNPVAYMPVGITIPNPNANFSGGEYATIANFTSNIFTNNISNITTLNVSGNSSLAGNLNVGGALSIGGTTPSDSAILDLSSSTKGLLMPRMTTAERDAIVNPATGLLVYNTTTNTFNVWNGTIWTAISGGGGGDAFTANPLSQFAATTSLQLKNVITDETGSGALVFGTSPTFTTPNIGSATGSISGNAGTATALQTGRTINGVTFDGTSNITVTAAAGTLTGTTLNSGVTTSSLTSVGTLVSGTNIASLTFTTNNIADSGALTIKSATGANALTLDSGSTGNVNLGTGASAKTVTIGNSTTSSSVILDKGASGNFTLRSNGVALDCSTFTNAGKLTTDSSGNIVCGNDASGGGSGITINSTAITGGSSGNILYNNAGTVGEKTTTGTGSVALSTSPVFTTPNIGSATGSISGNAGTATALQTGRTISISGDLTYTSPTFDGTGNVTAAGTLATVNSNVGSFGSATATPTFTVNAKGLITAAGSTTITPAVGSITGLGTGVATFLGTPSSSNLATALTDETGSGALVFGTTPTISNPVITNINPGANFTLTQNSVASLTSENTGAVVNTLYLKTGNVGVGTATPAYKVDVQGGYVNASSGLCINGVCQTTWSNVTLPIGINGQTLYNNSGTWTSTSNLFNGGGNIGIGTTTPGKKLDVSTSTDLDGIRVTTAQDNVLVALQNTSTNGTNWNIASTGGTSSWNQGRFIIAEGSPAGNHRLAIQPGGNIGFGTLTPNQHLEILDGNNYQIRLGNGIGYYDFGRNAGTGYFNFFGNQSGFVGYTFGGTDGEYMRISTAGNVGINTASPSSKLDVSGNISGTPSLTGAWYGQGTTLTFTDNATAINGTATNFTANARSQPTLSATNTGITTTNAYTSYIAGAPIKGTNESITNSIALGIAAGAVSTATNSYGLFVNTQTGATNNYAAVFNGGNVGIGTTSPSSILHITGTAASSTSGNGTNASQILNVAGIAGQATTGTTGQTAGNGSIVNITSGAGGTAPSGSTNGNGGDITIQGGSAGAGVGTAGRTGYVLLNPTGGNVGIGTTTPSAPLQIQNTGELLRLRETAPAATPKITFYDSTNTLRGSLGYDTNNGVLQVLSSSQSVALNASGSNIFTVGGSGSSGKLLGNLSVGSSTYTSATAPTNGAIIEGNVGIGTTTPTAKAQIVDNSSTAQLVISSTNAPGIQLQGDTARTNWQIGANETHSNFLDITPSTAVGGSTFSNPAISIHSSGAVGVGYSSGFSGAGNLVVSGNLGIGTTSPGQSLSVVGNGYFSGNLGVGIGSPSYRLVVGDITGQNVVRINGLSTSDMAPVLSLFRSGAADWSIGVGASSKLLIGYNPASYSDANMASAAKMVIDNSGNVGIGTTSPGSLFYINSTAPFSVSSAGAITGGNGVTSQIAGVFFSGNGIYTSSSNSLLLGEGSSSSITLNPLPRTDTSGIFDSITAGTTFNPTSGTGVFNSFVVNPSINQTGGANGISRGVYVNPAITVAADWRSIETSNNSGFAFYGSGTAKSYFAGNVGIGTNNPVHKLQVMGGDINIDSNGGNGNYRFSSSGTFKGLIGYNGSTDNVDLYTAFSGSTPVASFTSTGNIGINTTTPTAILGINGTAARTIQMERNTTAATAGQGLTISSGGAIAGTADLAGGDLTLKSGISTGTGSSAIHFYTATAGSSATTDRTPTEKMTILGNGNVGIGNTAPGTLLNIGGGTPTTAANGIQFGTDTTANLYRSGAGNVKTDGNLTVGGGVIDANYLRAPSGTGINIRSNFSITATNNILIDNLGTNLTYTSGTGGQLSVGSTYAPTSGTGVYYNLQLNSTINQTSTATGVTRGIYINPTITSAYDHRAFEIAGYTNNLLSTTTLANSYTALIGQTTLANASAQTVTNASSIYIAGAPAKGTNVALTNTYGLNIAAGAVSTATNSYGLSVNAQTGATNNYAAIFNGGNVGIGTSAPSAPLQIQSTGELLRLRETAPATTTKITFYDSTNVSRGFVGYDTNNGALQISSDSQDVALALAGSNKFTISGSGSTAKLLGNLSVGSSTYTSATAPTNGAIIEGNVGIGTTSPTSILALGGTAARTIQMERNTTAATAGQGLTISSGGAIAGTADLAGGDLTLKSGISTGTGSSAIHFYTATAGSSATTDRTPTEKMTILGNGNVGIGTTGPGSLLDVQYTNSISNVSRTAQNLSYTDSGSLATFDATKIGLTATTNISSNFIGGAGAVMTVHGINSDAIYSGTINSGGTGNDLRMTSVRADATYSGTISDASDSATLYGVYSLVSGDMGTTGATTHYGGLFNVSGTADTNYGIRVDVSGATTNYAAIFSGGNVGIGTTTPGFSLDVSGTARFTNYIDTSHITSGTGSLLIDTNGNSGDIVFGNNSFVMKLTSGNLGIGTTAPTSLLALGGTAARTIQMERNTTAATAGQGLTISSGGAIAGTADLAGGDLTLKSGISTGTGSSAIHFYTATAGSSATTDRTPTEKMTILGDGNVGIGTTSPTNTLHVAKNGNVGVVIENTNAINPVASLQLKTPSFGWVLTNAGNGSSEFVLGDSSGNYQFKVSTGGHLTAGFNTSTQTNNVLGVKGNASIGSTYYTTAAPTDGLLVEGNVGIGTTSATYKLTVNGAIRTGNYVDTPQITSLSGGLLLDTNGNSGDISFGNNYVTFKSGGNVGIGATSPGTILEIGTKDLGNGNAGPVITLGRNNNATNTGAGSINFLQKGGTAGYVWQDAAGNMRIHTAAPSNANDTAGTVIGTQTSTRETKQDIADYTDYNHALSMILDAPLHTFRYIKEVQGYGSDSPLAKTRIGYIADEVDPAFMVGNSIDQVSVNGILMASVKALNLKINDVTDVNNFNQSNPLREAIIAWFANATNGIGDVFAGVFNAKEKICVDGECLTKDDVHALILMARQQNAPSSQGLTNQDNNTNNTNTPTCIAPQILVNNACTDPAPEMTPSDTNSNSSPDTTSNDSTNTNQNDTSSPSSEVSPTP